MKKYKLLSASQIKEWDLQTMKKQNISSIDLMERAAKCIFKKIIKNEKLLKKKYPVYIFCGVGNNGGDGLVLTRLFKLKKYPVNCIIVPFSDKSSVDFDTNLHHLMKLDIEIKIFEKHLDIPRKSIIIDAVFGTGLTRPAVGIAKKAIDNINESESKRIISIDIPSGMYVDKNNSVNDSIVKSDITYTIELPKLSFLFSDNLQYITNYKTVKIGLDRQILRQFKTDKYIYIINPRKILKRKDNVYKNIFGHALIIAGSYGMSGAAILSVKAALKIGAGLVTGFVPKSVYTPMQTSVHEAMLWTDSNDKHITKIKLKRDIQATGIGPGIGTDKQTQKAVLRFIEKYKKPLIIDADALNIISLNKKKLRKIPHNSILTPHVGEFKRLTNKTWHNDTEKMELAKEFAAEYNVILILKGAKTIITDGQYIYINPYSNGALATAGSGDVLTGILTGLYAQGFSPLKTALYGVQIHTKASFLYDDETYLKSSMTANDIINHLDMI